MLETYLSLPYTIELTPAEDGYWFASIPLLKGCMPQGESREGALAEGIPIPEPTGVMPS